MQQFVTALSMAFAMVAGVMAPPTHAQQSPRDSIITLTGRVIDTTHGKPLEGVRVHLFTSGHPSITRVTDTHGTFHIGIIRATRYTLTTKHLGYAPDTLSITASTDTIITLSLTHAIVHLSAIDIATWKERRVEDAFQPKTVLEGAALDRQLSSSIAATIASQPGITQRYNGPMAAQPVIRGLTGDRVLVLEDGLRTGDIATTAPDHAVTIDPLTARRIEVVRGPAGLMYGTNTLGGVINVIREDVPRTRPRTTLFTLGSQFETVNRGISAMGEFTAPLPWHLTTRGDFTARTSRDTRTPSGPLPFTNLTAFDASLGTSWIGANSVAGMSIRDYHTHYGVPSSFNGLTLPGSHTGGVYVDLRRTTIRAEAEYRRSEHDLFRSIRTQGNYVRFAQQEFERGGFVGTRFGQLAASGEVIARYERSAHSGAIGTFIQWRDFRATGSYTGTRPAQFNSHAAFAFHEIDITPLRVMAGMRYDHVQLTPLDSSASALLPEIRSRHFSALTWTAGATYALTHSLATGFNIARAFRAPAIEELYSAGPHLASYAYEIGNPSLHAEVGAGIDAFLRYTHHTVSAELSFFSNTIRNFIQSTPLIDTVTGLPLRDPRLRRYVVYQATQHHARLTGIEASVQWDVFHGITLDAVVSTLRGTRSGNIPLPTMPPSRFRIGVHHDRSFWFVGGTLESTLSHTRVPPSPVTTGICNTSPDTNQADLLPAEYCPTPGVTLVNTTGGIRWHTRGIHHAITLSADNLLNTIWRDPLWRAKQVAPQPGRNIRLLYRVSR